MDHRNKIQVISLYNIHDKSFICITIGDYLFTETIQVFFLFDSLGWLINQTVSMQE